MNFWPELSLPVQHAFQCFNGVLLLLVLGQQLAPRWRQFFLGERWGGWGQSDSVTDLLHRPALVLPVLAVWSGSAIALICDWHPILAAAANVLLGRYYFVTMRWRGVARGYGAPGFMTYWFGCAVLLLAVTRRHAPGLQPLAVFFLQVDLALIVLSSGIYKLRSGYRRGEGMDYGLVNPMWSYWPGFYRAQSTRHPLFRLLNQSAWSSQITGALLMLVPATRWAGGLIEIATYVFIATQIRLGWLAEQMIAGGLLFLTADSPPGKWLASHLSLPGNFSSGATSPTLAMLLQAFLWLQLVLVPLCHAGLAFNFYGRRRLPGPLQMALDAYANFFGVIVWRVFSVDHLNFHVNIYAAAANDGSRPLSRWQERGDRRFWHVGEAITVTSLFTTLKYYPQDDAIFRARVFRYARTLPRAAGEELVFEYVAIRKLAGSYRDCVLCRYHVDPDAGTLRCEKIAPDISLHEANAASLLHPGIKPGSYAPRSP
jgi:hypothetical protein